MRAVQDQIREWVPSDFATLGTDGFGLSDTRGALRRHFKVDAESITLRTLETLARRGEIDPDLPRQAFERYQLHDVTAADPGVGMGDA
jgi:pyruvate dehydrogenase E1 component